MRTDPSIADLSDTWLEKATGIPGFGDDGPTLEIFEYGFMPKYPIVKPSTPGFSHIAFAVDEVAMTAQAVLEAGVLRSVR